MHSRNGVGAIVAVGLLLGGGGARASDDPALPADRLIAAIRVAVAAQPGDVREVEVGRDRGRTVVEVELVDKEGRKIEVKVDADTNEVVGWQK